MQAWGTLVVTLATLMVVTVDAKIYERCELAKKLEKAGLNGFKGYTVGDCKIPFALSLIHTPVYPPHPDLSPFCNYSSFGARTQSFQSPPDDDD